VKYIGLFAIARLHFKSFHLITRRFNSGFASRDYRQQHQHRPAVPQAAQGGVSAPQMQAIQQVPNQMVFNPAAAVAAAAPHQPPPSQHQQQAYMYPPYGGFFQQPPPGPGAAGTWAWPSQ